MKEISLLFFVTLFFSSSLTASDARMRLLFASGKMQIRISTDQEKYYLKEKVNASIEIAFRKNIKAQMEILNIPFDMGISVQESPTTLFDTKEIEDVEYNTISQDFQMYPTDSGRVLLRPVTVLVTVTVDGETFSDTYSTKAIEFEVEEKENPMILYQMKLISIFPL